ncbi:MAG: hypothetical protein M1840_006458 [Geoglossum simile]|nr:MAG: hypothetical protein M1840_006458 [Geoglossum simile]
MQSREATKELDAAPEDPLFVYLWRGEDPREFMRLNLSYFMDDPYFIVIVVVDESLVISFGVGVCRAHDNHPGDKGTDLKDLESGLADKPRHQALGRIMTEIHKDFDEGEGQHYELMYMYTSPLHRQKGAATLIVDWFRRKAKEMGVPVIVAASPGGEKLYLKLEFSKVRRYRVCAPDEDGVEFPVMKWRQLLGTSS